MYIECKGRVCIVDTIMNNQLQLLAQVLCIGNTMHGI